ncbi:unnamed protein product [marine sediment metagenome]|uniref:DUF2190 domain-containing protein n=1 Tax=marine sediment metagenome TaxID=412755 RepID=X1QKW7_9ZZZZ
MPLLRIDSYPGVKHIFIAGERIADLATVELLPGERQVRMGSTGNECIAAGVARGTVASGALVRVVTQGIVSGVKTASGYTVEAKDTLAIATSGCAVPFNNLTANLLSGAPTSGGIAIDEGEFVATSGPHAALSGQAVNTNIAAGRVLGRALTSGASGYPIQMLVCLE